MKVPTQTETAAAYATISTKILALESNGASDRMTAKLYREFFRLEDALKAFGGAF